MFDSVQVAFFGRAGAPGARSRLLGRSYGGPSLM